MQAVTQHGQRLPENPDDYSAIGGPDDERVYGRARSDLGTYPWNPNGGPYDRDMPPSQSVARRLSQAVGAALEGMAMVAPAPLSAPDDRAPPPDLAAAGVDRRSLDDRAARRDQPVKALARRQLADRPGGRAAGADQRDAREMSRAPRRDRRRRSSASSRALVELDARAEEVVRRARQDHARVDELAALHARHDAHDRVVIRAGAWHAAASVDEIARRLAAARSEIAHVRGAMLAGVAKMRRRASPASRPGSARRSRASTSGVSRCQHALVGLRSAARERQQHVVADRARNGLAAARQIVGAPGVMEVQRRAVIDQP